MAVLFPRPVTVYRQSGATRVKGRWTPGTATLATVIGRVRYFTAFEISTLPEGKSNIGHIKFFSNSKMNIAIDGSQTGDIVLYEGKYYELTQETHTPQGLISHYRYEGEHRPSWETNIV